MQLHNDKGQPISGEKLFAKPEYHNNGEPNWNLVKDSDDKGFYTKYKYDNGEYTKNTVLPIGTKLIRYGNEFGRFVADDGASYEMLSLPYIRDTVEFHRYIVIAPFEVIEGKVAPGFDTPDVLEKATQYFTGKRISNLLGVVIKEVYANE